MYILEMKAKKTYKKDGERLDNKNAYIPSIDAKDIYLSSHCFNNNPDGYNLKLKNGQLNLRKFVNSLDYSLDM